MPMDPEAGLTDSQREALHAASLAQFEAHYARWVSQLNVGALPLSSLPHYDMTGTVLPPKQSLLEAQRAADVIVEGTVLSIAPDPQPFGTSVLLGVERAVRGEVGSAVVVRQGSHLEPTPDWSRTVIVDAEWEPLLLPGQRVILFLNAGRQVGQYVVQAFTGMYHVDNGQVTSLKDNPFAHSVNGTNEAQWISSIQSGL